MTSPSERYFAAKERTGHARTRLGVFEQSLGFDLDPFQLEACRSVEAGRGVLVAAPTVPEKPWWASLLSIWPLNGA